MIGWVPAGRASEPLVMDVFAFKRQVRAGPDGIGGHSQQRVPTGAVRVERAQGVRLRNGLAIEAPAGRSRHEHEAVAIRPETGHEQVVVVAPPNRPA